MKFSERKGYTEVKNEIQVEFIKPETRNKLWNTLYIKFNGININQSSGQWSSSTRDFRRNMFHTYFETRIDQQPDNVMNFLRDYFFEAKWYKVFDFIEYIIGYFKHDKTVDYINKVLEDDLSGYRFINGLCTEITDNKEIETLEDALNDDGFPGVQAHLTAALALLSNRENPDYRNSIKESISAVESLAQKITGQTNATLGDALKILQKKHNLHASLKQGFEKIYGYTSDKGGIRHAMQDDPNLTAHDAKFFLLSCTSFINYLKSKM
jgi:hypothetical protein